MSGLLKSIADRWSTTPALTALVPMNRMYTGRVPHTKIKPLPYVSVIQGGSYSTGRTDRAEYSRVPISFHIWTNDAELHTGEEIAEEVRKCYASECWDYEAGRVRDVIDEGPGSAAQVTEPNYEMWEIVKVFTFCLEQTRHDAGQCCGSSSSDSGLV